MPATLSPIASEFSTQAQADAYDVWFRAKVQASLDDTRPRIPHDQAMVQLQAKLQLRRDARSKQQSLPT
jgi:hypothetical protein